MSNLIDIEKLDEFNLKLKETKDLLIDVLELHDRLLKLESTRILFGIKRIEEKPNNSNNPKSNQNPLVVDQNTIDTIRQMYILNYATVDIARKVNLTPAQVLELVYVHGIYNNGISSAVNTAIGQDAEIKSPKPSTKNPKTPGKLSKEDLKFLAEKYQSGEMRPQELAKHLGVSTSTIKYHIERMKLLSPLQAKLG